MSTHAVSSPSAGPAPGNRNDCKAWELSGAKSLVGNTTVIADGGYRGAGLIIPHRREPGQTELPAWKEAHNISHRKVRARVASSASSRPPTAWAAPRNAVRHCA